MFFVFLGLFTQVIAKGWWEPSKAIDVTNDNRKEYIGGKKHLLLEFFTPPCMWCEVLFPDLEKLIEYYTDENSIGYRDDFVIARVNGQDVRPIVIEYRIQRYPTLLYFPPDSTLPTSQFQGEKNLESLKAWIEKTLPKVERPTGNRSQDVLKKEEEVPKVNLTETEMFKRYRMELQQVEEEVQEGGEQVRIQIDSLTKKAQSHVKKTQQQFHGLENRIANLDLTSRIEVSQEIDTWFAVFFTGAGIALGFSVSVVCLRIRNKIHYINYI